MQQFLACGDDCVASGDARWAGWYGGLKAGPFNTGCYADCMPNTGDGSCPCGDQCAWCGTGARRAEPAVCAARRRVRRRAKGRQARVARARAGARGRRRGPTSRRARVAPPAEYA